MRALRSNYWLRSVRGWMAFACLFVTLCAPQPAWAKKDAEAPPAPEDKRYVEQYALVLLCISLGMVLICKPSGRAQRVKMPDE